MADTTEKARAARRARHERILDEVAQEEAEAVEAEIAETASTLDIPLHLRRRTHPDLGGPLAQLRVQFPVDAPDQSSGSTITVSTKPAPVE